MSTLKPQALVLDFGGVVTRTLFETHALTERALGLAPGTLDLARPVRPGNRSALARHAGATRSANATIGRRARARSADWSARTGTT